ncbi:9608_t:CDS:2 [Ambispora gerdemannii]|uniref:9608_t:CDS:1 n=1 Tax=Ambispora gerdemannii TaxID=144530 RepID=A0A9N8YMF0_9GLOM|nr:9608_t:CDS:2 [Ambispora gerdemannii]
MSQQQQSQQTPSMNPNNLALPGGGHISSSQGQPQQDISLQSQPQGQVRGGQGVSVASSPNMRGKKTELSDQIRNIQQMLQATDLPSNERANLEAELEKQTKLFREIQQIQQQQNLQQYQRQQLQQQIQQQQIQQQQIQQAQQQKQPQQPIQQDQEASHNLTSQLPSKSIAPGYTLVTPIKSAAQNLQPQSSLSVATPIITPKTTEILQKPIVQPKPQQQPIASAPPLTTSSSLVLSSTPTSTVTANVPLSAHSTIPLSSNLDVSDELVTSRKIQDLVAEIDPNERVHPDLLLEIADEFIESVAEGGALYATHRRSKQLEVKDVQLYLESLDLPRMKSDLYAKT